jgi:hypothetical protein
MEGRRQVRLLGLDAYRRTFNNVPGWMHLLDLHLFDRILSHQLDANIRGDILEIGSYHGKSAIALGYGLREDETLHICDLFGSVVDGVSREGFDPYDGLTVEAFVKQYTRFHERWPELYVCASNQCSLGRKQFRFIHVDGGHAYDVVSGDATLASGHADEDGVVVFDDYRSVHTPGVPAALWESISNGELYPFMLSEVKLYATNNLAAQRLWFDICDDFALPNEIHEMHGYSVRRVWLD